MSKESKTKGKIRVFLFELEGSDETLLESVKNIAGAVNRTFTNPPRFIKTLSSPKDDDSEQEVITDVDSLEMEDEIQDSEEIPSTAPKTKKSRKFPTPQVLADLDLKSGNTPFRPYCEQKGPKNDTLKYLTIAAWLKEFRDIKEISIHHVHTCYRAMGWSSPEDMGRVFRNAKKSGYFSKGSSNSLWAINHIGENRVLEMNKGD